MHNHDFDKALSCIDKSFKKAEKDYLKAGLIYRKAVIYKYGKKDKEKAKKEFETIIKEYADSPYANVAARELGMKTLPKPESEEF